MVPSGEPTRADRRPSSATHLEAGDIIIDGGNSRYTDDQAHAASLAAEGHPVPRRRRVRWRVGADRGLRADGRRRRGHRRGRAADLRLAQAAGTGGFVHAGPVGAGHFTKMVHNGIEYGIMQAYGEGYELLKAVDLVPDPDAVIASWPEGTVIRSWLLDLLIRALQRRPGPVRRSRPYAQDSGEGRWTIEAAIENAVPMPVITSALFARFASRQTDSPAMKVVAALRNQFGGHAVGKEGSTAPVAAA